MTSEAVLSQDCFSGELTSTVMNFKYLRQQAQHAIGPHVTARLQLTDTTFAAGAKAAAEQAKAKLRKRLRLKAESEGVPAKLSCGSLELLKKAVAVHSDMQESS